MVTSRNMSPTFPTKMKNCKEAPPWCTHPASQLLSEDVKVSQHKATTPAQFQLTQDEYKVVPLNKFRKHIYQEERKQREMPMKIVKCNKLREKRHKQVIDEEAARWHAQQVHNDIVDEMFHLKVDGD